MATLTHGRGFRLRLSLTVAVAAAAMVGLCGWMVYEAYATSLDRVFSERAAADSEQVLAETLEIGDESWGALDDFADRLAENHAPILERWKGGQAGPGLHPSPVLPDFDRVDVLDAGGRVLLSSVPETTGSVTPEPAEARIRSRWVEEEGGWVVKTRYELVLGEVSFFLIGGDRVDADWLARLGLAGRRRVLLADGRRDPIDIGHWHRTTLQRADAPDLVVATERSDVDGLRQGLREEATRRTAVLALAAALLGGLLAWRITRPVGRMLDEVGAVSAGEADFSRSLARGELDEVPQVVSHLRRDLDEQQRRRIAAERLAAWRDAARRVAHEVKNPLAPIRLTVENLIKARRLADGTFEELFPSGSQAILEEVTRLERIVTEFSEFARLPRPKPVPTDLDVLIDQVVALHAGVTRRGRVGAPVAVDELLFSRALRNVIANAVEAGGEALLTVRREGETVTLMIEDPGPGFPAEGLERVFEPYFTTKEGGTGLGLAIAHRIIGEHGGSIVAANRPGGGAEVVITLPTESR